MKKILHVSKYYYPFFGGTEQIARDVVLALKDKYEQKVIAFNDGQEDRVDIIDGIEVIRCGCFAKISGQSLSTSYRKQLHKVMVRLNPDIVVFHYPNPFVSSLLLRELKATKAKLVLYWHLDIIRQKYMRLLFIQQNRRLLERAVKIIATSPNYIEGSKWLQSVKEKCIVIPNCINVERMAVTQEIQKRAEDIRLKNVGKTICIAVGRHTEYKGFTYLIQASKLLDERFVIYITGTGELTEKLHVEAKDDKKIVFTGQIDDTGLKALILASNIFCFPSITKNEAFGIALAEGMYFGKPTVTFTIPGSGVNYVSVNEETGIEVENKNIKSYAEAIKKLANDVRLQEKYGKAGKKRVEKTFLSTQFYDNVRKMFLEL